MLRTERCLSASSSVVTFVLSTDNLCMCVCVGGGGGGGEGVGHERLE